MIASWLTWAGPSSRSPSPLKRLRPPARPSDGDDLAIFQLKDGLDIQQGSEQGTRMPDPAAALEVGERVHHANDPGLGHERPQALRDGCTILSGPCQLGPFEGD